MQLSGMRLHLQVLFALTSLYTKSRLSCNLQAARAVCAPSLEGAGLCAESQRGQMPGLGLFHGPLKYPYMTSSTNYW